MCKKYYTLDKTSELATLSNMLSIICGEDTVGARNYFLQTIQELELQGKSPKRLEPDEVFTSAQNGFTDVNLFSETTYYATSFLIKKSKRSKLLKDLLEIIILDKTITVITYEDYTKRELFFKDVAIKEFAIKESVFMLLDSLSPGNKKLVLTSFITITQTQDVHIVFSLLYKHVRALLLAKKLIFDEKIQPWQIGKIKKQSSLWEEKKLMRFLEGLIVIEKREKTGSSPLTMEENLVILLSYVLQLELKTH